MTAIVTLESVRRTFGPRGDSAPQTVLDGIDLAIEPGSIFALLGPNGAGKTTTIDILTTLLPPTSGRATVAGFDVVAAPREVQRRISVTGQSAAVDARLTGDENLRLIGRLSGLSARASRAAAAGMIERFGLEGAARKAVGTYSGGMRRRLDLALSLVVPTSVLFLDEPTTGLDTRSRQELWTAVRALTDTGTTVFLTTQYLEEADQLADRIAVLNGGRIVADGSAAELKSRVGGEVVTVTDAADEVIREIPTDGSPEGLRAALDLLDREGLRGTVGLRSPSLDDVFLSLTGAPQTEGAHR